jgi:hypothetical protein
MPAVLFPGATIVQDADPDRNYVLKPSPAGLGASAEATEKRAITGSFTLQAWVKGLEIPTEAWQHIAGEPESGARMFWHWGNGVLGAVHLRNPDDTWAPVEIGPGLDARDTEWHHLLMTWDQSTGLLTGYWDAQVIPENLPPPAAPVNPRPRAGTTKDPYPDLPFTIAGSTNALGDPQNAFSDDVLIDDVAYWDVATTAEMVQWLFDGFVSLSDLARFPLGDMDCDGDVDFDDIDPFVLGLNNPAQYEFEFGQPPEAKGDMNGDGDFDFDDIPGFVDALRGTGVESVPEPGTLWLTLVVLGGLGVWGVAGRKRD